MKQSSGLLFSLYLAEEKPQGSRKLFIWVSQVLAIPLATPIDTDGQLSLDIGQYIHLHIKSIDCTCFSSEYNAYRDSLYDLRFRVPLAHSPRLALATAAHALPVTYLPFTSKVFYLFAFAGW